MAGGSNVVYTRLLDLWLGRREQANAYRQQFEPQWNTCWETYMNRRPRPDIPNEFWTYQSSVPDGFSVIETIMPQHFIGMLSSPNWFGVEAPEMAGDTYKEGVRQLLLQGWNRSDMYMKSYLGIKYGTIIGHCTMKTYWEVKHGQKEVLAIDTANMAYDGEPGVNRYLRSTESVLVNNGPQTKFPDLLDLWFDPSGREMWVIERMETSFSLLEYENEQYRGGLYDEAALRRARRKHYSRNDELNTSRGGLYYGGSIGGGVSVSGYDVRNLIERVEGKYKPNDEDACEMWQCWGWVPPSIFRYSDTQWRLMIFINDHEVIRDVPAPTPDRLPPYDQIPSIPIPHRLYGESVLTFVGPLIDIRNFIEDARREEVIQKLWRQFIVDENSNLSPADMFMRPGGMLWVGNHMGTLKDVIMPVPQVDVMPSAYQESAWKEDQIKRASSATDQRQGVAAGSRTTATEANLLAQFGGARFQLATSWYDDRLKKRKLERDFALYQSRLEQPQVVRLTGDVAGQYSVDLSQLLWDIDIYVDSGSYGSMDSFQLQNLIQLYNVFANNPRADMWLDHRSMIRDAFHRTGDPGAHRHVRSEQEVRNEMAQMAQQQEDNLDNAFQRQLGVDQNREISRGVAGQLSSSNEGRTPAETLVGGGR